MSNVLFTPIFVYILWISFIYVILTIMRAPSVWGIGRNSNGTNPFSNIEVRASANLSNQFEWPVIFWVISLILIARPEFYQTVYLWLTWLFVFGRLVHSLIHIFTTNIRLRGMVFNINFLAVLMMWGVFALNYFNL